MGFLNKEKRKKYIGFDDFWFVVTGILLLSLVTDYLFSGGSFTRLPFLKALINWSISLMFSMIDWLVIRATLIELRKRYPTLQDNTKRIPLFFLSIVIVVFAVDYLGNEFLGYLFNENYNHPARFRIIVPIILISTMTMAIYEAIYYYVLLKASIREEEQAKRAIVQAQLDTLRNQAQPHFFFNSLNTLNDIIDQNTKTEAREFVNRLSEVYRFILESGNLDLIPLSDELKFAQAYMHIQKERFGRNLQVQWDIDDSEKDQLIIPMSLQLLMENAVKHNVISKAKPLVIRVEIAANHLIVCNKVQPKSTQLPSTKLGLINIQERYALIANKPIHIDKTPSQFTVQIPLLTRKDQKS